MISRRTAYAVLFAILSTASLAIATAAPKVPGVRAVPVVQLETVVVTGHRAALDAMN
jgi:hypothetical protein